MKKIIGLFALVFIMIFSVNRVSAEEEIEKTIKDKDGYTYHFKKEGDKWVNYKATYVEDYGDGDIYEGEIYFYYDSTLTKNCIDGRKGSREAGNCVYRDIDGDFTIEKEFEYYVVGDKRFLEYKAENTYYKLNNNSRFKDSKEWYYYYKSKIVSDYNRVDYYDGSSNHIKKDVYIEYYRSSTKKVREQTVIQYNKYGNLTSYKENKYYKGDTTYGKKNVVISTTSFYSSSSPKVTKYTKYRSDGTKKTYKISYFSKYTKPTKLITYSYNKNGVKKSNKESSAYKYVTTYKNKRDIYTWRYPAKKVTKAKYDNKGKLEKSKVVKATSFNTKYYLLGDKF